MTNAFVVNDSLQTPSATTSRTLQTDIAHHCHLVVRLDTAVAALVFYLLQWFVFLSMANTSIMVSLTYFF